MTLLKPAKDYYLDNMESVSSQEREYYKPRSKTSRDTPGQFGAGQVQLASFKETQRAEIIFPSPN